MLDTSSPQHELVANVIAYKLQSKLLHCYSPLLNCTVLNGLSVKKSAYLILSNTRKRGVEAVVKTDVR